MNNDNIFSDSHIVMNSVGSLTPPKCQHECMNYKQYSYYILAPFYLGLVQGGFKLVCYCLF